jgi:beta-galactosidase
MLQQALNFQEAHNDNRGSKAVGDGLWVMFDYNRGYAPDLESSGCMDIMRLPKYSRWFYRSQRLADERHARGESGPMVFIASEWTPESPTRVRVFSNCMTVELRLNGETVEERFGDRDFRYNTHLAHSPFTFDVGRFAPGTLEALGRLDGSREVVARHGVRTPGAVEAMDLWVDLADRPVDGAGKDVLFCHAALRDAAGTLVASAWENAAFGATGGVRLVGANPYSTDAGIASILAETEPGAAPGAVYALAIVPGEGGARVLGASAPLTGSARPFEVRRTDGGAELLVDGRVVASLDERAPKFRIPASAPPEKRDPYRHG